MNLNTVIPLTSASRLQSYLQRFCSREAFQLISFPLCGALPPTPLSHSLFLDSTIMKKGFLVKNVSPDFTILSGITADQDFISFFLISPAMQIIFSFLNVLKCYASKLTSYLTVTLTVLEYVPVVEWLPFSPQIQLRIRK